MTRKLIALTFMVLIGGICPAQDNYTLEINGNSYDIGLDTETDIVLSDGTELKLNLSLNDYQTFESKFFSFAHKNIYRPSKATLGEGLDQSIMNTSLGTGVMVQEYFTMDPAGVIDMMVKELTKAEIDQGYTFQEKEVAKKVGEVELTGKEVITSHEEVKWIRSVLTCAADDRGLLIITFMLEQNADSDRHLLEDFWKTLKIEL